MVDTTVKSNEKGNGKFTINFTEDDIGKTYTYKLTEVNDGKGNVSYSTAEHTITVAISLNENNELVAALTQNGVNVTQIVAAFENVYDYTPTQSTEPDPGAEHNPGTKPEPGKSNNPQTGDGAKLHPWFALLFVSGGGILAIALYSGKKKEED